MKVGWDPALLSITFFLDSNKKIILPTLRTLLGLPSESNDHSLQFSALIAHLFGSGRNVFL